MLNYLIYKHTYFVTELNIKNHQKKTHMHSSIIIHNFYHVVFVMMSQEAPEYDVVGYIRNPRNKTPTL